MIGWLKVCLLLAVLCLLGPGVLSRTPAVEAAPALPRMGFGIDSGGLLGEAAPFARAEQTGARWTRFAIYWSWLEPVNTTPEFYNWTESDKDMQLVNQSPNLLPVVYVTRTPSWAGPKECGPIDTTNSAMMDEWRQLMGALAEHYPKVPVWVLYNEADNTRDDGTDGCFGNDQTGDLNGNARPDTGDYAEMLAAARTAVRKVNPNALVAGSVAFDSFDGVPSCPGYPGGCVGGSFNYNFLPSLFQYMKSHPRAEPYADLMAFNYYDIYGPYWESRVGPGYPGIQAKTQMIRQLMSNAGVSLGLFVMETGVDSSAAYAGMEGQSQCVVIQLARGQAAGLDGVAWWTLRDIPSVGWFYGLVDISLTPKPSYSAFQGVVQQLNGYAFDVKLSTKKVEAYQFSNGTRKKVVAWATALTAPTAPSAPPCSVGHKAAKFVLKNVKKVRVSNMYNRNPVTVKDNKKGDLDARVKFIKIKLPNAPSYIELNP